MPDYLVTYFVPVTIRIENVDDSDMATNIAAETWEKEKVLEAGEVGLDHTSFYFCNGGGTDVPWTLDATVEED